QPAVPAVLGLTQAAATAAILQAGLIVGTVTQANSTTFHIGTVMAVNPREGTTLAANAPVDLVISLGTITPLIVGAPSGDVAVRGTAQNLIVAAGMVVGVVTQQSSPTVPAGVVVRPEPADRLTVGVRPG